MATTILLSINCLLVLGIYLLLVYIAWIFFQHFTREEGKPSPLATLREELENFFEHQPYVPTRVATERRWDHLAKTAMGLPGPIDEWTEEDSNLTVDFDESHEIQSPQGTLLGACGVRTVTISGYNTSRYNRVYEVWLDEKDGGEKVSKFLVNDSIIDDESLQKELAGRGEMVEKSRILWAETQALYIEVMCEYYSVDKGGRSLDEEFEEWINIFEFSIWRKGMVQAGMVTEGQDEIPSSTPAWESLWTLPEASEVLDEIPWIPQNKRGLRERMALLETALERLDAPASLVDVKSEPYVTSFMVIPRMAKTRRGKRVVRLTKFKEIADDLALALGVSYVEIQDAPQVNRIQIRIPNEGHPRTFHQIIRSDAFAALEQPSRLPLGHGLPGPPGVTSLVELKSLLVGGYPWTARMLSWTL
jgi:hypothetical protein